VVILITIIKTVMMETKLVVTVAAALAPLKTVSTLMGHLLQT
jgi:hypothetical protein